MPSCATCHNVKYEVKQPRLTYTSPTSAMAIAELGEKLLALCMSAEDKLAEVQGLLESLTDEDRP